MGRSVGCTLAVDHNRFGGRFGRRFGRAIVIPFALVPFALAGLVASLAMCATPYASEPATSDAASTDASTLSDGGVGDTDVGDGSSTSTNDAAGTLPASCKKLLGQNPTLQKKSAVYDIRPAGRVADTPLHVYCDMDTDNGGWTLVARSAPSGVDTLFGWSSATGDVSLTMNPYSLNVMDSKLVFTEVLVASSVDAGSNIPAHAYKFAVATDFLTAYSNSAVSAKPTTVVGDCSPTDGPMMLQFAGATSLTDVFFFRDIADLTQHRGLRSFGFDIAFNDCAHGGLLNGTQGLVYVR